MRGVKTIFPGKISLELVYFCVFDHIEFSFYSHLYTYSPNHRGNLVNTELCALLKAITIEVFIGSVEVWIRF